MFSTSINILSVDSRDRDTSIYPNANQYKINLPKEYKNIVTVKLKGIEFPMSFYVFSQLYQNTKIMFNMYDSTGTTIEYAQLLTIPDGNYNTINLVETLTYLLDTAFTSYIFAVTVDPVSCRLNISNNMNRYMEIDTRTFPALSYYLGFPKGNTYKNNVLVSPGMVVLNPYNYALLSLNDELNLIDETGGKLKSAFAKVPLCTNNFNYIFRDEKACTFNTTTLNPPLGKLEKLHISWRFHDGNLIQFNNVDHSFTLQIECISCPQFDPHRVLNIQKEYTLETLKQAYIRERNVKSLNPEQKATLKESFKALMLKLV